MKKTDCLKIQYIVTLLRSVLFLQFELEGHTDTDIIGRVIAGFCLTVVLKKKEKEKENLKCPEKKMVLALSYVTH